MLSEETGSLLNNVAKQPSNQGVLEALQWCSGHRGCVAAERFVRRCFFDLFFSREEAALVASQRSCTSYTVTSKYKNLFMRSVTNAAVNVVL